MKDNLTEKKFIEDSKKVMRTIYDATYTINDLCRAQRRNLIAYGLRLKTQSQELDKAIYDTETHVIKQFWNKLKSRFELNEQDIFIYWRTQEDKFSFYCDAIVLPQLNQPK